MSAEATLKLFINNFRKRKKERNNYEQQKSNDWCLPALRLRSPGNQSI